MRAPGEIAPGQRLALAFAAVLAAGALIRFWFPAERALWLDEAYSSWNSALDWRTLWTLTPQFETHPPVYYSLLKLWRGAMGDSVFSLRALSILSGLCAVAVAALASRETALLAGLQKPRAALAAVIAAAVVAASPMAVDLSRQARPYGIYMLVGGVALVAILRLARGDGGRWRWWSLYLVALELTLWLHSLGALFAACFALALLAGFLAAGRPRRLLAEWAAAHLLALILYLPCLAMILDYARTWSQGTWLVFRWTAVPGFAAELYGAKSAAGLLATIGVAAVAIMGLMRAPNGRATAAMLAIGAFGPFLLAVALSAAGTPVLLPRALSPALVIFAALVGAGAAPLVASRFIPRALVLFLLVVMAIGAARALPGQGDEDWGALVNWIEARRGPGDAIWVYPNEVALPLRFAYRHQHAAPPPMRELPAPFPAIGVPGEHPSGTPAVPVWSDAALEATVARHQGAVTGRIWLVRRMPGLFDPGDSLSRALAAVRRPEQRLVLDSMVVQAFAPAPAERSARQ